ncbi:MAG: hypothetical protein D6768_08015 [Chloroflexi bacterium]|nr:MAG: hypothetical protein D6768_08015 [Chloroflexota bacterium]
MIEQENQPVLDALESERRYTAKELHDGVAQTTLQIGLQAGICRKMLEHNRIDMLAAELAQLEERAQVASGQVRALIQDLRPPTLDDNAESLRDYLAYAIEIHHQRGGPPVDFQYKLDDSDIALSDSQKLGLMRIAQEGLLNVRKHAQAQHVRLGVAVEESQLYLTISDDGKGFDAAEVAARPAHKGGVGLANLQTRTAAVGGSLTVGRGTTGRGTSITVILPLK